MSNKLTATEKEKAKRKKTLEKKKEKLLTQKNVTEQKRRLTKEKITICLKNLDAGVYSLNGTIATAESIDADSGPQLKRLSSTILKQYRAIIKIQTNIIKVNRQLQLLNES